jgi:hypothetical protein
VFDRGIVSEENWRSDVPTYSRVAYRQVYPGIDVVYRCSPSYDGFI